MLIAKLLIVLLFIQIEPNEFRLLGLPDEASPRLSLAQCIRQVGRKFFALDKTVTYSMSLNEVRTTATSATVLSALVLPELFQENQWSFFVKNFSNTNHRTGNFHEHRKSDSYIIQIRNRFEISENIDHLKEGYWNPHAKFLVVSTNHFGNPHKAATEVIQALWNETVLNGVVLIATPENDTEFHAYTWFPYRDGNCGDNFTKVQKIDSCTYGTIETNLNWYSSRIPKRLNNCPITVRYVDWPPFTVNMEPDSYGTSTSSNYFQSNGIEPNLINMIASQLQFEVYYTKATKKAFWGEIYENGSATGNLLGLKQSLFDVVIGSYAKTLARSIYFDATPSFIQESLIWCVPNIPIYTTMEGFITIIKPYTWLLILLLYFLCSALIWHVSQTEPTPYRNSSILLRNFGILIGVSVSVLPKSLRVRVLVGFLLLFSFNLGSAYITFLTSILANPITEQKYSTPRDIYTANLNTYFLANTIRYFEGNDEVNRKIRAKFQVSSDMNKCLEQVAVAQDSATCVPKHWFDYVSHRYVSKSRDPLLYCFKKAVITYPICMYMRKGFPFYNLFNTMISRIISAGFIHKWENDILEARINTTIDVDYLNEDDGRNNNVLRFEHLFPIFVVLFVGEFIASVAFLLELVVHKK